MKFVEWMVYLCVLCALCGCNALSPRMNGTINLAGNWEFSADPNDTGEREAWFNRPSFQQIKLPGSMAQRGLGNDPSVDANWTGDILDRSWFTDARYETYRRPGNVKVPFWLTPLKWYVGPAWYRREFNVGGDFAGKRIVLFLERPHWTTKVWIDGKPVGTRDSLSTPHEYDLGPLEPGKHAVAICVDNRVQIGVGVNASSVTDHTQTNWNGMVGRIELHSRPAVAIEDVQVYPDVSTRSAKVVVTVRNATTQPVSTPVTINGQSNASVQVDPQGSSSVTLNVQLGADAKLWDEFSPQLHSLKIEVGEDSRTVEFGLRDFHASGTQFTINGRPVFLRGTLDCCIYPLTGYPPTDVAVWKRNFTVIKAHGLNHIRFHSWCPPEAAFVAADEMGLYLQIEAATWANEHVVQGPGSPAGLGDGKPVDAWVEAETLRILKAYGNHPSFVMMAAGNEPGGPKHGEYLARWVTKFRELDSRHVYTGTSGWPELPENQYQVVSDPRIQHWGEGLNSRINAKPPETTTDYHEFIAVRKMPVVSHEIGQWCVYPNFDEIRKYKGVTRAFNFEIFRDSLKARGMFGQAHDFLIASGKLQALCYKEEIESALRTPGMGGFQLLSLSDFSGQGTALVGVLDPFLGEKGYITAAEYRKFAGPTVPLARMSKRVWTNDETFAADVEIAHFGANRLIGASPEWKITRADGSTFAQGGFGRQNIPFGNGDVLGNVRAPLTLARQAQKLVLTVSLDGTDISNSWEFWVYPKASGASIPPDVLLTDKLDDQAIAALNQGRKVLLIPAANTVKGDSLGKVEIGFSPIFWNTSWTTRQAPHTLGILCNPKHPALEGFPTEFHTNWQWWDLISKSQAMILNDFPVESKPIVQVIDDWVTNRKLGLIVEAKVGKGKLLICSIDLQTDLANRPVARQMLHSLTAYVAGPRFDPRTSVDIARARGLFNP